MLLFVLTQLLSVPLGAGLAGGGGGLVMALSQTTFVVVRTEHDVVVLHATRWRPTAKEIVATHPFPVEASIYNDVVQLNLSLGGETHHASRFVERRLAAIIA
ncbi:MAG: hypothetical protein P8J50_05200 [Acidimicrobiales bacterium]|nr:hypothetical protein [Acidimicrobiales bacterium]